MIEDKELSEEKDLIDDIWRAFNSLETSGREVTKAKEEIGRANDLLKAREKMYLNSVELLKDRRANLRKFYTKSDCKGQYIIDVPKQSIPTPERLDREVF